MPPLSRFVVIQVIFRTQYYFGIIENRYFNIIPNHNADRNYLSLISLTHNIIISLRYERTTIRKPHIFDGLKTLRRISLNFTGTISWILSGLVITFLCRSR
jgi:hypothetical protein